MNEIYHQFWYSLILFNIHLLYSIFSLSFNIHLYMICINKVNNWKQIAKTKWYSGLVNMHLFSILTYTWIGPKSLCIQLDFSWCLPKERMLLISTSSTLNTIIIQAWIHDYWTPWRVFFMMCSSPQGKFQNGLVAHESGTDWKILSLEWLLGPQV